MKALILSALWLTSLASAATQETLNCDSVDAGRKLRVRADFIIQNEDDWMGRGSALLVSGAPGAPAGIELRAPDTTFNRGAWTADRLNFYFRDDRGQVLAGIVVEDYFAPTPVQKPAKLDGALGNITLICTRASASAGATRE